MTLTATDETEVVRDLLPAATIADLQGRDAPDECKVVQVLGKTTKGTGWETFYWDSASTDSDDTSNDAGLITTVLPTGHTGAGRWKRGRPSNLGLTQLATQAANTIVANATGSAAAPTATKLVNALVDDAAAIESSKLQFTPSGSGAVARTVEAVLRELAVSVKGYGAVGDGVTDDTAAITAAIAASDILLWPAGNYKDTLARTIGSDQKWFGDGIGQTTITNTVAGIAVTMRGTNPEFIGIDLVAANATEGVRLGGTVGCSYARVDASITTAAGIGLKTFSDDVSRGVFYNKVKATITAGTNAYIEVISGTGFVNDNEFTTPVWRTTANPGTVAVLNGSKGNVFYKSDASNYGASAGNKSWDVQGTTQYPLWLGGLLDTSANDTGFTFAAGVIAPRVIGVQNEAGTKVTWSGGSPALGSIIFADKNRMGEVYLDTPSAGVAGPAVNFYDTGNLGDQLLYMLSGILRYGPDKATAKFGIVGSTGVPLAAFDAAIPAGGTAGLGYRLSSTANFGVFFGSGAPTLSAAKGSLYLRSDGTTTNDRAYINTDSGTTWTALTTVA